MLCGWHLRAGWMAQELFNTFGEDIQINLVPVSGGAFRIYVEEDCLFDRKADAGFPSVKALKQKLRDRVWPDRELGHIDR